ncbi:tigger transposable element-derived protein 6-like [Rhizophagus clarus]|uniref:Tigger transposable element-derived protein 6-like n=1 Tax=Rhizophagus clarus TaxID=94130 RepID=A0A8H3QAZ9_9GLOM|nr:tigger transposable element-derived protein 6-like [Rhizophagus clarus]
MPFVLSLHIDRSTISKILEKKAKWFALVSTSASKKTFCHREVKYPQVEKALGLWVENANANNLPVSEIMIKEKAFYFAQEFNISRENILFSNGWIEKFKRCNNIRCYHLYGEANSAPLETLHNVKVGVLGQSPPPTETLCVGLSKC